ncbi:helicase-related protein [Agromyces allii]|uniref:Helicase n=1 Tax=Agromyces allii TaxID=393607 RepID=A0ABP5BB24_9MICO|nr:helicase-related protein [Agromyces allii]
MTAVDADAVMAGLKGFQRDAVDHVIDRFYGEGSGAASGRFLVADETGLGKSIVARGVIARAIEQLEVDDSVQRIDVVYVCSNADLAAQNLRRLNVTGDRHIGMATRLTLLAKESSRLAEVSDGPGKKVNLVSFTPGTSFSEGGWRQGNATERAMLTLMLDEFANVTDSDRRVTRLLMHGTVQSPKRFDDWYVKPLRREIRGELDPRIVGSFRDHIERDGSLARFVELRDEVRRKRSVPDELWHRNHDLIAQFRQSLAKSGVDTLEPDLIILDEFQRFRHLLDPESGDAAELAHALFEHPNAKVLLLSATPYKPFTNRDDGDDDHARDFLATIRFLAGGSPEITTQVASTLGEYRQALVLGHDADAAARRVREALLPYMSRSERPPIGVREDLVRVRELATAAPTATDLREWASLRELGRAVGSPIDLEYWKSIPYFAGFMDGYKPAERLKATLQGPDGDAVAAALASTRSLDADRVEAFEPVDLGNSHLRALAEETVGQGWWRLLWVPPTMPYLDPGPVFSPFSTGSVTKQVIFSAWSGVPTAVAGLLSYEADRLAAGDRSLLRANTPEARLSVRPRLMYRLAEDSRPAAMSTLALFWPHPTLAALGDPLRAAREQSGRVSSAALESELEERLLAGEPADQAADAFFAYPGSLPPGLHRLDPEALVQLRGEAERIGGLVEHVRAALDASAHTPTSHPGLARLAAHAPGAIAWRAVRSIAGPNSTDEGVWVAAFALVRGIRSLFNRTESTALLVTLYGDTQPYWQSVLDYCADGNLQSVLDEYLFQLHSEEGGGDLGDDGLLSLARRAVEALELRPARYLARDNAPERNEIPLMARFALRYGGRLATDDDQSGVRQGEVRAAFNSPFAPFVLASTSVGQEGIDFHWWSHSVVHWNLPTNPVDFEQREGRVNRFAGHAVRKNVAEAHWGDVLASDDQSAWGAAFNAATRVSNDLGEFSPWWMYPGSTRIDRVLARYPLSRDIQKYERLRDALTLYRLTLGQPRQEDMVELLAKRGVDSDGVPTIDLRPPRAPCLAVSPEA